MKLIDGKRYRFPNGIQVQAVQLPSGEWRLNEDDSAPLFYTDGGVINRLVHTGKRYQLVPTDLQVEDLTPVE